MMRTCALWILVAMVGVCVVGAQNAEPRFDVVSIRPSAAGESVPGAMLAGRRYRVRGLTAGQLIGTAYADERPLARQQLVNGPPWIAETRYDIEASAPDSIDTARGALNLETKAMLRNLLAERFGLKVHFETREQPVFALQVLRTDRQLG